MRNLLAVALLASLVSGAVSIRAESPKVLIYTRNGPTADGKKGFVHDNIAACTAMLQQLGKDNGFATDVSDKPEVFTDANLKQYRVIIFANSNNEAFATEEQKVAFQKFIRSGGGFVGIHSACGSERKWPWFWSLLGGTFVRHPKFQPFTINVVDRDHPSTKHLGATWKWADEFYYIKEMPKDLHILLEGDLSTLTDSQKPKDRATQPLAWCHEFEGGRSWYTSLAHKKEDYSKPDLQKHILGGILWAMDQQEKTK